MIWILNKALIIHYIIKMSTEADSQTVFNELTLDYPLSNLQFSRLKWDIEKQAWLALMSSSNDLGLTFKFWALSSRLGVMFLEVILKLQLKPPLIIPISYLTLPGSIWLPEVLPEVPPEVLLEVLTSFNHTWLITNFIVWLRSKSLSFEFSELPDPQLTLTWPGPELDNFKF